MTTAAIKKSVKRLAAQLNGALNTSDKLAELLRARYAKTKSGAEDEAANDLGDVIRRLEAALDGLVGLCDYAGLE